MPYASTTFLEAVNTCLSALGEQPVTTYASTGNADVEAAVAIINEVSKDMQSEGWHFNTENDVPYTPSGSQIAVPDNVFYLEPSTPSADRLTIRDQKLYNLSTQSYTFTSAINMRQIVIVDFEDLPEVARRYIASRAARVFTDRFLPNQLTHNYTLADEQRARLTLEQREGDEANFNVLFDNNSTRQTIYRGPGALDLYQN